VRASAVAGEYPLVNIGQSDEAWVLAIQHVFEEFGVECPLNVGDSGFEPGDASDGEIHALVVKTGAANAAALYALLNKELETKYRELLQDGSDGLEQVNLLVVQRSVGRAVFHALNQAAGAEDVGAAAFDDDGGDPDGAGPYLADVGEFTEGEIAAAKAAGATVGRGYKFAYPNSVSGDLEFRGYPCSGRAFALDRDVALQVKRMSESD